MTSHYFPVQIKHSFSQSVNPSAPFIHHTIPHIRVLSDVISFFTHQWLTSTTTLQYACDGPPLLLPVRSGGHSLSTKRLVLFQSLCQFHRIIPSEPVRFDICPIFALQTLGGTRKVLHYASGLHCQAIIVCLCCKLCWTVNIWAEIERRLWRLI